MMVASVASMIDLFNMENIRILQKFGCQVDVAANFSFGNITGPGRVEEFRQELVQMGVTVYHIPIPRSVTDIREIVDSYCKLKRLCRKNHYILVHTQSPIGGAISRLAARHGRKKGTRVVYTAHGFHFYKGAPVYRWLLFYPVEKWLSGYTDTLITINREDFWRARTFYAGQVCRVPGIGVDTANFCADKKKRMGLREEFGFQERDFIVLSVGQLSKRKNQEVVIRAMARIKKGSVRYVLVGLGEREQMYRDLIARLGLGRKVYLAGYRGDVADLLQMADCFAFPSLQEGLPVSLMEAMAAGVPVICSRIRGNCDLIRDGVEGKVLDADDVCGFAREIVRLMENPGLADRYRKNARKRITAFSRERVDQKMQQIYGQYLADGVPGKGGAT